MTAETGTGTVRRGAAWLLAVPILIGGCSTSFSLGNTPDESFLEAGEDLIEGELADQIGLGPLEATCTGEDLGAGDTFTCTAQAGGLTPIEFTGTVDGDEEGVNLTSTNLLLADQVEQLEAFAAELIAENTAQPIQAEDFECADSSVIVASGEVLDCQVTDPADGTVYAAPVTIDDVDSLSITVNVGDPIG